MQKLDEIDAKISDYVGSDDDIALGKCCGNCRHELHNNRKICNAFTKETGKWNSCNCEESTTGFKITTMVQIDDKIRNKANLPTEPTTKSKQFIPLSELFSKKK